MSKEKGEKDQIESIENKKENKGKVSQKEEKLENIIREDLIIRYNEENEIFKKEKDELSRREEEIVKNIKDKDVILQDLIIKNKKLYSQLDEIQKEVDNKLDKISTKKVAHKEKILQEQKYMKDSENLQGRY